MEVSIDPYTREAIQREYIEALREAGLVVLPNSLAAEALLLIKDRETLLKQKHLTQYQIAKAHLIPGKTTAQTIKNMISDGRITKDE